MGGDLKVLPQLQRLLRPHVQRLNSLLFISRLKGLARFGNISMQRAEVTGVNSENRSGCPVWFMYGFYSVPTEGSPVLASSIGGMKASAQVLAIADSQNRPESQLEEGDAVLYSPVSGCRVIAKASGDIEIQTSSTGTIKLAAPNGGVQVQGDLDVSGGITSSGDVEDATGSMAAMRTVYNSHVHGSSPTATPPMT